ncbi:Rieske (2Fe-2S) protein [Candidatus Nitronereus thalassa]|uniref:Rieske 2Fe-2S domain-containing protein n=1 Tax=Candidatus Nitronereus thalassa TaxID=3020898 RepID=A0ABU3K6T3_9BACT|nr:Rieske 2Fe-2S domain-containing protein [Candidatus Nitronereus thalassa]MDT7042077.1 Rieske 2Fe-2S domain-containing protein [Candidatus Nitronereus thalassa]
MSEQVTVANTNEVAPGTGIVAEVNGKSLAVFNVDGTFHVIDNTCVHRGGPLGEGDLEGEVVTCPWHNWEFNVKTGVSVNNPSACVATYPVVIEGTEVKVSL